MSSSMESSYPRLIERAQELERQDKLTDAADIYRRVAERLSQLSSETLEKRPQLRGLFIEAANRANVLYRRTNDFDAAVEVSDVLAKPLPETQGFSMYIKAQTLADAGRQDESIELLKQAAGQEGITSQMRLTLATEALWIERPAEALEILDTVAEGQEGYEDAAPHLWYVRFRALNDLGRPDEAEQAWLKSREAGGEDAVPSFEIVEMFIRQGDLEKALDYADMETDPPSRGFLRGLVAELSGKHEWANDEWWRVARESIDPEDTGFADWIESALRLDDADKARSAITAGLEKYPYSPRLFVYSGVAAAKRGDMTAAEDFLRPVVQANEEGNLNRTRFIRPADHWLIEQAIADAEARAFVENILFGTGADGTEAGQEQEPPTETDTPQDDTES